jgi:hypothetical protein
LIRSKFGGVRVTISQALQWPRPDAAIGWHRKLRRGERGAVAARGVDPDGGTIELLGAEWIIPM